MTAHGLRHTHCSLLFEAGASIKEVQFRLGHRDVKTTLDIYTHVTKKAKSETINKFTNFLNDAGLNDQGKTKYYKVFNKVAFQFSTTQRH
nr:tyrosine-type recombinase/integrase [Kurthia sp. Dielmo]